MRMQAIIRTRATAARPAAGAERQFADRIDRWVLDAARQDRAAFDDLLVALPGVYPARVLDALRRLTAAGALPPTILARAIEDTQRRPPPMPRMGHRIALPVPHPLDYDWRFGEEAIDRLLGDCLGLSGPADPIALVGAPSIMRAAIERDYPRRAMLLDRNLTLDLAASVRPGDAIVRCDVRWRALPALPAAVVVLDPPWYGADMCAFLWAAHCLCAVGGHVLMSMPPVGARPGVTRERARILGQARALGFVAVRTLPAALPYVSPLFERNALRAEGLDTVPPEWRRGDLVVLVRESARALARPSPPTGERGGWMEEEIRGVRIRVRRSAPSGDVAPSILPCVPGDILPSVSRRDGRRLGADMWTSGNRIFRCRDAHTVASILRGLAAGRDPCDDVGAAIGRHVTHAEAALICAVARAIGRIVDLERAEAALLGGDG